MKKNLLSVILTAAFGGLFSQTFTSSNLPIVIINANVVIPKEPKVPATMKIIYNGPTVLTYVTDTPNVYNGNVGIERRGHFSDNLPQKPYNFETRDASGLPMDTSLLGMPSEHDWLLIAGYGDKAFVRNTLANKLFKEMGHYAARSSYCEVVLNGNYQGIYLLTEKIKRDKKRVAIAKLDYNDNAGDSLTGGYILLNDYWTAANSWQSNFHPIDHPTLNVHFVYNYPSPDSITAQQKTYIQDFIDSLETALYSPNFADTVNGYAKYMSIQSYLDYFIVNELSRNNDGFKKSIYMYKEKDKLGIMGKLKYGPVWDFDWAWKNLAVSCIFNATNGSGWAYKINDCTPDVKSSGWFVRLLQDTGFQNKLKCRWTNLRQTILDTTYLFNYIDSIALNLDAAQMRHYVKWGNLGLNSGAPEIVPIPTTFQGEVNALKNWIRLRIVWLDANMPGTLNGCTPIPTMVKEEEENFNAITIYPNPTEGKIQLAIGNRQWEKEKVEIEIYNILGEKVTRSVIHSGVRNFIIDLSSQPKGIYFVKVMDDEGNTDVKKIIIH